MKLIKERLENLDDEKFYLILFSGTRMPNNTNFVKLTMFDDTFETATQDKVQENKYDIYWIELVKKVILENLTNIEKMLETEGEPIKSSYTEQFALKINNKTYKINRNSLNEEGRNLYNNFKSEIFKILDIR